ncbi:MAG: antibiotic biosynthesis monooxygenase [Candidatus Sumerlaeia bacterium]
MFVVSVSVHVKPENVQDFIDSILENARGTRQEPGNLRFDVLQDKEDASHFMLYEVYRSEDDLRAHQTTPHYLGWREKANPWMAQARKGTRYTPLFPEGESKWESK